MDFVFAEPVFLAREDSFGSRHRIHSACTVIKAVIIIFPGFT